MLAPVSPSQFERKLFFEQVFPLNLRGIKRLLTPAHLALTQSRKRLQAELSAVRAARFRA
jgi:hypothetical protein